MLKNFGGKEMSFLKHEDQERMKESALLKLETLIDWNRISREMENLERLDMGREDMTP